MAEREETKAEKIRRLQWEIAIRHNEIASLVLGDPRVSVSTTECSGWANACDQDEGA